MAVDLACNNGLETFSAVDNNASAAAKQTSSAPKRRKFHQKKDTANDLISRKQPEHSQFKGSTTQDLSLSL
jgi:hypothetical protein